MNLVATIEIYGGGPGSGCRGDNCGRPTTVSKDYFVGKPTANELDWVKSWGRQINRLKPNVQRALLAAKIGWDAVGEIEDPDGESQGLVVRDSRGNVLGIASLMDNSEDRDHPSMLVSFLATNPTVVQGDVHGVGTRLMQEVAKIAASKGTEVALSPTGDAEAFYKKLGMHEGPKDEMYHLYWTKDDVNEIAQAFKD